jgi:type IV secretion system protein VirB4
MGLDMTKVAASIIASRSLLQNAFMHVPYVSLVNDWVVRLRDNSLMCCIRFDGLNAATADMCELEGASGSFASIIAQLGPDFAVYTHRVSRPVDHVRDLDPIRDGGFAAAVDEKWAEGLRSARPRDVSLTVSLIRRKRIGMGVTRLKAMKLDAGRDERHVEALGEAARFLRAALGNDTSRVLTAKSGDLLGFLGSVQTAREVPIYPTPGLSLVADDVVSERVTFASDGFELSDGPFEDRFGVIRAVKSYPVTSFATILDEFAMSCDFVITQSFVPLGNNQAASLIERRRRTMRSAADVRAEAAEQLERLHERVLTQEVSLGEHHMTVALMHSDREVLREIVSDLEGCASNIGMRLVKDGFAKRAHYFAQFPGNMAARSRVNVVTNSNFADFASLHRTPLGKGRDEVPWGTPISVFPTYDGSSFRFNFHRRGDAQSEPPAGHTVILGETGSGKSVLAAFLMAQARRADARLFVFDYRGGLEMAVRALGGAYSVIESGTRTGLNPLWVETDEEGVDWLTDWLTRNLSPAKALSPLQARAIREAVMQNAAANPRLRKWSTFGKLFAATDDEGEVQSLVSEWAEGGRFGWVFGETVEDTFSLDGDVVGFDLTQILDAQSERERMAVLSYVFRRVERQMRDRRRTIVVLDEAWKAIDNPYFAQVIEGWLATLRKQNAVVLMLSQNASQLARSRVGERIFQFFPTQVIFPDAKSSPDDFAPLRLNEAEAALVTGRWQGRKFLLRDDEHSVLLDADLSSLGPLLHVLGGGRAGLSVVGRDYRDRAEFWRAVL